MSGAKVRVAVNGYGLIAQVNYAGALNRDFARVVSCNITASSRTMHALNRRGLVKRARAVLLRRTDPWESHANGMINTVVPETKVPSHQYIRVHGDDLPEIRDWQWTPSPAHEVRGGNEPLEEPKWSRSPSS